MEIELQFTIQVIGAMSGALSISIAVFLQMLSSRKCHPKYVAGFLLLGSFLILLNTRPFVESAILAIYIEATAYIFIMAAELYIAKKVYAQSEIEDGFESLETYLDRSKEGD